MKNDLTPVLVFALMIFLFGALVGFSIGMGQPEFLIPEKVKSNTSKCSLESYLVAQKYMNACSPAFKAAVEQ